MTLFFTRSVSIDSLTSTARWLCGPRKQITRKLPATFLAVDWTGTQLAVIEVLRQGTRYIAGRTFKKAFAPDELATPVRISEWLYALIQKERLNSLNVVVAAPRRFVAFKALTLPNIHDDRLADAVACQAETAFPIAGSELAIDFIARPYDPAQTERAVLIAAIPRMHLDLIEQAVSAAGLQTVAVLVSELGLGGTSREDTCPNSESDALQQPNRAVISISGSKIEFLIQSHGKPILCYAAKAPDRKVLVGEIGTTLHRLIASMPQGLINGPLTHLHLIGREAPAIQAELNRIPGISLTIEATQATEEEVKLDSIVSAFEHSSCRIDFKNPRRSIDPQQLRWQQRARWGAMAAAILVLCLTGSWLNTLRIRHRIATLQREVNRLQKLAEDRKPIWDNVAAVGRWQDGRVDWSDVLCRYLQSLPTNEQLMLKSLEVVNTAGAGTIDIEAYARSGTDVHQLLDQFIASTEFCKTQLKRLELKAGDPRYSAEFALGVSLTGGTHHVQ